MHPYLFFYLVGGVTFLPLTFILVVAVLWLRMPRLDPTKPRPTDLPSPHILQEEIEQTLRDGVNGTNGADKVDETSPNMGLRSRKTRRPVKARSKSDQLVLQTHAVSSTISVATTSSINTAASAPALLKVPYTSDDEHNEDEVGSSGGEDDDMNGIDDTGSPAEGETPATLSLKAVAGREVDVPMQADPNLNREGYVRMTRVPRLGPAAESISDYMTNMLFQPKNARPKDSYYAVLRYDTLFLYESDQQRDCKAVVPMTLYEVKIFPRNLPDNEVFNKEHPIQIKRKIDAPASTSIMDNGQDEYYIFIHTPVVKEDWFLALVYAAKLRKPGTKQKIQDKAQFEPEAIRNHIRILHSDKHHEHTRWFNSFLGRIFLGVYKTKKIEDIFIQKITRKTLKLKRPSFLGEIKVRSFNVGHSIPYITRTKLHELAMNGELSAEFHLAYRGGVRVEIEVDVGLGLASLKPVKVTVVLAVLVKSISGMMSLKIKAPPTNRFWIGFQEPPEMDIVIEPIVADKAIKLNMVLSAIESKIREAMVEAVVLPNMDDTPFFNSHGKGGIFEGDEDISPEPVDDSDADSTKTGNAEKNTGSEAAGGKRRGSESSFGSEHAPPPPSLATSRKQSWSSTGTGSDADPESLPIASTPPVPSIYLNQQNNNSSSNASTMSTSSIASKFKRFSQAHFSSKSSDITLDPSKLNTKPTVATSIATAIRTPPSSSSHSSSSGAISNTTPSKLPSVIPKLSALSEAAGPQGPRIFTSSPGNGPAKKASSSSLRRLSTLESPATDDADESDGAEQVISPTGNDPLYQSLRSPVEQSSKRSTQDGTRRTEFDTFPRSAGMRKWDTALASREEHDGKNLGDDTHRGSISSSSSHIGIAGILEGSGGSGRNSISGTSVSQVQGNLANLFNLDTKSKKNQSREEGGKAGKAGNGDSEVDHGSSKNNRDRDREHGRKNSGDSLMNLKMKKDMFLKKVTSRGSEEDQDGQGVSSDSSSMKSTSKFSLDNVGTLLGHRRRGSVSSVKGTHPSSNLRQATAEETQERQDQDTPRRGLTRSLSSTDASTRNRAQLESGVNTDATAAHEADVASRLPPALPSQAKMATPNAPSISPTESLSSSGASTRSNSSSRSAYLQQKSQAALGSAKAWVKRSMEDRRASEEDPLLAGKMRLD